MLNRCIICSECYNNENNVTVEHIIPEALGGKIRLKNVCKRCNSLMGSKLDCRFIDNPVILVARYKLKIRGKDRSVPNPFPKEVDFPIKGVKGKFLTDKNGNLSGIKVFNKPIYKENMVIVPSNLRDTDKAQKIAIKKGLELFPQSAYEYEVETLNFDISQYTPKLILKNLKREETKQEFLVKDWFPQLVKIGYEITFFTLLKKGLEDIYVDDPVSKEMRKFLYDFIYSKKDIFDVPCDLSMDMNTDSKSWNSNYNIIFEKRNSDIICKISLMNIVFGEIVVAEACEKFNFIYSISYNGELV